MNKEETSEIEVSFFVLLIDTIKQYENISKAHTNTQQSDS